VIDYASMGFQHLTLGELPVELEGIRAISGDKQGAWLASITVLYIHLLWCTFSWCASKEIGSAGHYAATFNAVIAAISLQELLKSEH
jgi:hypothetical protein